MFELIVTITTCTDAISSTSSSRLRRIVFAAHTMHIKMYVASNYTLSMTCVSFHFTVTHVCGDAFFTLSLSLSLYCALSRLCFLFCQFSMSFALNNARNSSFIWHWQRHLFSMFTECECHMITLDLNQRVIWIFLEYVLLPRMTLCRSKYEIFKVKPKKNTIIHELHGKKHRFVDCRIWIRCFDWAGN